MTHDPFGDFLVCVFVLATMLLTWAQGKINDIMWAEIREHRARIKELEGGK